MGSRVLGRYPVSLEINELNDRKNALPGHIAELTTCHILLSHVSLLVKTATTTPATHKTSPCDG